jgi:hypothetical protein
MNLIEEGRSMRTKRHLIGGVFVGVVASLLLAAPASALDVGQKAPDFALPGSTGKEVKFFFFIFKGTMVIYTFIQAFAGT